ncbi:MAG: hypothetical protein M1542_00340 [Thermotogae bacterium]|nr:hypothetical protein [Thermotogota bacterium]MCL5031685.1 hypothetical protein [Thermotogota bacterium]
MKVFLYPIIFLILAPYAFGATFINTFLTSYASQSIQAQRIVVEEGQNAKVRYENILRNGRNEIVNVMAPMPFEWALIDGKTYVIEGGEMRLSPVPIVDIEQRFIELLSSATATTAIATQNVIYQGEPSIQINLITRNSTYVGIISKSSMILKFIKVQRNNGSISMIYTQIAPISIDYFNKILNSFKVYSATPDTVEMVVWQLISNLSNVNVMSMKINDVIFTVVSGMMSPQINTVCYIFKMDSKVSPDSLVSQFKAQGYNSIAVKYNDFYVVVATNGKTDELKAWISKVFANK